MKAAILHRPQEGVSLILLLLVIFGFAATFGLAMINQNSQRFAQERKTDLALRQAKEALIGSAVTGTLPGRLRCPEILSISSPIAGQAQNSCSTSSSRLGRFPWRTLDMEPLYDGSGELLWYVLSPGFSVKPINSDTIGTLQVDGQANAAVAAIIAPGPPLGGQTRGSPSPATPPLAANYLDLVNSGGTALVSKGPAADLNDRILVITQAELFKAVNLRVLAEIRGLDDQGTNPPIRGLRNYHGLYATFPWADTDGDGYANAGSSLGRIPFNEISLDAWIADNNWYPLVSYNRMSANSAKIGIGTSTLDVVPCSALPCP